WRRKDQVYTMCSWRVTICARRSRCGGASSLAPHLLPIGTARSNAHCREQMIAWKNCANSAFVSARLAKLSRKNRCKGGQQYLALISEGRLTVRQALPPRSHAGWRPSSGVGHPLPTPARNGAVTPDQPPGRASYHLRPHVTRRSVRL